MEDIQADNQSTAVALHQKYVFSKDRCSCASFNPTGNNSHSGFGYS